MMVAGAPKTPKWQAHAFYRTADSMACALRIIDVVTMADLETELAVDSEMLKPEWLIHLVVVPYTKGLFVVVGS